MIYVYEENGQVVYTRDLEPKTKHITLERMIPMPVKENYDSILNANFETGEVWYDLVRQPLPPRTVEDVRSEVEQNIKKYDKSTAVNAFYLNNDKSISTWLDKADRVGLVNSVNSAKSAKLTEMELWLNGLCFKLKIDQLEQMLAQLELYAMGSYNATAKHLAEIMKLTTVEELDAYDYKLGYPEKLIFALLPDTPIQENKEQPTTFVENKQE